MIRCMQGLTADQRVIKDRAGVSTRGRKLREPYGHLMLSCPEGQQPTVEVFRAAARGALVAIGISERHYGVLTIHQDTDHRHAHGVSIRRPAERQSSRSRSKRCRGGRASGSASTAGSSCAAASQELVSSPGRCGTPSAVCTSAHLTSGRSGELSSSASAPNGSHNGTARHERAKLNRHQTARRLEQQRRHVDRVEAAVGRTPRRPAGCPVRPEPEQPARNLSELPFPAPDRPRDRQPPRVQAEPERPARNLSELPFPAPDRPRDRRPLTVRPEPERPAPEREREQEAERREEAAAAAAEERARAAAATRRTLDDAQRDANDATYGVATDIAGRQPRGLPWDKVAEQLTERQATEDRYHEHERIDDGAPLDIGLLRIGLETDILEHARAARPGGRLVRPVTPATVGAAISAAVDAIQDAAGWLIDRILEKIPGRAETPAAAAAATERPRPPRPPVSDPAPRPAPTADLSPVRSPDESPGGTGAGPAPPPRAKARRTGGRD